MEIPPVGHYFASTIQIAILSEIALQMLRPGALLLYTIKAKIWGSATVWPKVSMIQYRYSSAFSFILTLINIVFTFALITPVVNIVSCIFWVLNMIWGKYSLIYLNNRKYEVGTAFSQTIFSAVSTSLILSQVAVFFVIWSMDSSKWNDHIVPQVYTSAALIVILLVYKYAIMRNFENLVDEFSTLAISTEIDRTKGNDTVLRTFRSDYYFHPELAISERYAVDQSEPYGLDQERASLIKNANP